MFLPLVLLLGSASSPASTVDQAKTYVAEIRAVIGTYHNEEDDTLRFEWKEIAAVDQDLSEIDSLEDGQDADYLMVAKRLHIDMNALVVQDRLLRMVRLI